MTYAFDPELVPALAMLPAFDLADIPAARQGVDQMLAEFGEPDESGVRFRDELVPGPDGAPDVRLRIYTPDRVVAPAAVYARRHSSRCAAA